MPRYSEIYGACGAIHCHQVLEKRLRTCQQKKINAAAKLAFYPKGRSFLDHRY